MDFGSKTVVRSHRLALLALVLLATLWGYNWVVMKVAVQYASPFAFATLRNLFGALSVFLVLRLLGRSLRPQTIAGSALFGFLQSGCSIGLLTWALVEGGAGKTAILTYTMTFWTLLFAWFFLGERLRRSQSLGVGMAFVGLIFILMPFSLTSDLKSKVIAVVAGIFWAAASIVLKKLNQRQQIDVLSFTAWQMLFGSLPLALVSAWVVDEPIQWTTTFIVALVYNAVPGSAIAWFLWLYALKHLPAGMAGLGGLMTPLVGLVAASLQLGEVPSLVELMGIGLILGAIALATIQLQPQPKI